MGVMVRQWIWPVVLLAILALCNVMLLSPMHQVAQSWAAVGLTILLPGWLVVQWLLTPQSRGAHTNTAPVEVRIGEQFVYAVGAGFGVLMVVMLGLSYLPGGLNYPMIASIFNVVILLLLAVNLPTLRTASTTLSFPHLTWPLIALAALMVGVAFLRFTNLGYSDLHGDEALVGLRATDVILGWERALFVHKKGPGEILIGTTFYVLTGELTEFAAHLPFALASWSGVLATYLLGRQWFGAMAGWWAGAMVAVDGYLMAFGRMLQYQSIVFLTVIVAVLVVERARQQGANVTRHLLVAAFVLAAGLLSHYEAVMAFVPIGVLLGALWLRQGGGWAATQQLARWLAGPLLLGVAVCAVFYVPFVLDPEFFRDTFAYVFGHRLAGQAAPEVFPTVVGRSTLYSSSYYFWTLVVWTVGGMVHGYGRYTRLWARLFLSLLLAGALVALLTDATAFLGENAAWAQVIFVALFAPFWFGKQVPAPERAAWLWFGLPLMAVMFFIAKPGTHVYIFFIPWALLTGMVVGEWWAGLVRWWGVDRARLWAAPVLIALTLVFGLYVYQLFVDNEPEVLLTWDENRPRGYWTSYESPAFESIFGFPISNGWKTVASLYEQGILQGRFDTNDRFSMVPDWYLRGEEYCGRDEANYYLLVPYPLPIDRPLVAQKRSELTGDYYLWGVITSNEQPHMEIYARGDRMAAEMDGSPRTFREEDYEKFFDQNLLDAFTRNGPLGAQPIPNLVDYQYGSNISLIGYSVDRQEVERGGELELNLYWRGEGSIAANYFVSIQALDPVTTAKAGQRDGEPGCNRFPTTTWVEGDEIFDRYFVPIAADAAPGEYAIFVKMYNDEGSLPVIDANGNVGDGAILTTIRVK